VTEKVAAEILPLPMNPQLKHSQQKRIAIEVVALLEESPVRSRSARVVPCATLGGCVA